MKKIEMDNTTTLTATEAAAVNGGGSAEELGKSYGAAAKEAMVNFFQPFTDWYYGV